MTKMLVVVVYDIPDDRRRLKVFNLLESYGRRVQYSVFECFLNEKQLKQMYGSIKKLAKPNDGDNVRAYWVPKESWGKGFTLGSNPPEEPPNLYII